VALHVASHDYVVAGVAMKDWRAARRGLWGAGWAVVAACLAASGHAQLSDAVRGSLELATIVEKVVEVPQPDGATKAALVPIAVAAAGDEVVYTVTFVNVGTQPADSVRITNPIPSEMRYLAGTAFGPGSDVLYSVDGGLTFGAPKELLVRAGDGTPRTADAADYTHIRWVLRSPLDPRAKGFARFRAVVH
jgi:uncharacterized repeat protein (TIGR01451 family)